MTKKNNASKKNNAYLKYSGLAFQMVAIILVSIYIGSKLDQWLNTEKPYLTALTVLIGFGLYMYKLNKDLIGTNEQD